jgi:hypothetical protein
LSTSTRTTLSAAAGSTLTALRRPGVFEDFHLLGREDLGEPILHFPFEIGDLLALVVGEVELVFSEAWDEVSAAATGAARATTAAAGPAAATRSPCAAAGILPCAGAFGVVSGHRSASQHRPGQGERQRQFHEAVHRGLLLPPGAVLTNAGSRTGRLSHGGGR